MWREMYHSFNIGMSVPLWIELKNWVYAKENYFIHETTCYKLPQHPRSVFPCHLDVSKSSVHMVHLMMFLITSYFTEVEKQVAYSQHQFDRPQKRAYCLLLLFFLKTWFISLFWHWRSKVLIKGCSHYDLVE